MPTWVLIINFLGFQLVWWIAILKGSAYGIAALIAFSFLHIFYLLKIFPKANLRNELLLVLIVLLLGFVVELLFSLMGVWQYSKSLLPQIWLMILWIAFAMCLRISFGFLNGRLLLAGICAACTAPFSYIGGAYFSADYELARYVISIPMIAFGWFFSMPLMLLIASKLPLSSISKTESQ